jgi:hypothetical protein
VKEVSAIEPTLAHGPKRSSDAAFGRVFGLIFIGFGVWPLVHLNQPGYVVLGIGLLLLLVSQISPRLLAPFNVAWMKFGDLLHSIVSPVVMGLVYFLTVVPTGFVIRMMGKDLLRTRRDKAVASYWIARNPAGPSPQSMKQQF